MPLGGVGEQVNFINEQLDKKWKENKIHPAPRASDYAFIRRISLDVIGRIAKPKEIAEFFQGREIDGKKVYGAYIYTERGSEGITMGVTNVMYNYGFDYDDPKHPYRMDGFVNSAGAAEGLDFYKSLYKCCQPQGLSNAYMTEGLDAFKSGQVAMMIHMLAGAVGENVLLAGHLRKRQRRGVVFRMLHGAVESQSTVKAPKQSGVGAPKLHDFVLRAESVQDWRRRSNRI